MKIYLAGKIQKNDWRHKLVPELRYGVDGIPGENGWRQTEQLPMVFGHTCVGPFFVSCDHGCYHTEGGHGTDGYCIGEVSRKETLVKCARGIEACDLFIVWAGSDFQTAYGTVSEIGMAAALSKPIVVIRQMDMSDKTFRDAWFPLSLATMTIESPEPVEAINDLLRLLDKVKSHQGTMREFLHAVARCYRPREPRQFGLLSNTEAITGSEVRIKLPAVA
jgi:nucleoside 2-deoxyribosyltransferase